MLDDSHHVHIQIVSNLTLFVFLNKLRQTIRESCRINPHADDIGVGHVGEVLVSLVHMSLSVCVLYAAAASMSTAVSKQYICVLTSSRHACAHVSTCNAELL